MDTTSSEFKVSKARALLILEQPFFATLACNSPWVRDDSVGTMATDGETFYYADEFVKSMSMDETKFVVCHEVLHNVFDHMGRRGSRDPYNYNVAADIVINRLLIQDNVGSMPKCGIDNPGLFTAGKGVTENIYDLLPPPPPEGKRGGHGTGKPGPLDKVIDRKGTKQDKEAAAAKMKVKVAQAAQIAKMHGKLSAGMARLVTQLMSPVADWKEVLRRFVNARAKVDRTYARPNRRFLDQDMYVPSLKGESIGVILIGVDCSGSIDERTLNEFAAEISAIHQDVKPSTAHVVYFDSEVSHSESYTPEDTLDIKPHGGGGTDVGAVFRWAEKNVHEEIVACVMLTDGYTPWPNAPGYPVLWAINTDVKAPWGETIQIKR